MRASAARSLSVVAPRVAVAYSPKERDRSASSSRDLAFLPLRLGRGRAVHATMAPGEATRGPDEELESVQVTGSEEGLPECQCVHCGARFNSKHLVYTVEESRLDPEVAARFVRLSRDPEAEAFLRRSGNKSAIARAAQAAAASALRTTLSLTDANGIVGRGQMHVLSADQARMLLTGDFSSLPGGDPRRGPAPSNRRPPAQPAASAASSSSPAPSPSASATRLISRVAKDPTPGNPGAPGSRRVGGVLLDVGAGDGSVTAQLATLFDGVIATEVSAPMAKRLAERGYGVLRGPDPDSRGLAEAAAAVGIALPTAADGRPCFDGIALLNVLDRCDTPLALLTQLRSLLKPGSGRLLIAVVLPFRPFVEDGAEKREPWEPLPTLKPNDSFERSVSVMWTDVLRPLGFRLESVSRVPYLSDGDTRCPVYSLDDALIVLSVPPEGESADDGAA